VSGLPAGRQKAAQVRSMFDLIAPRYDLLNRVLTFGMDVGWRRRTVASLGLDRDALILDVACGTGDLCRELAAAGYRPVGFDFSAGMLAAAGVAAPLVQADGLALPVRTGSALGLVCGFALRNVVDIGALFDEFARALGHGGRLAILEVAEPRSPVLRAGHHVYFHHVVPVVGGLLSDGKAYRWLPESTAYLPAPEELRAMLRRRGFDDVGTQRLGLGAAQLITGTRS
jgi:demethylmenaquinone methyltransferase / 2-methoxy-6-polyprenyl-1,4-benzoquinol methylase